MALFCTHRNPNVSLHRDFIGQNALQTNYALTHKRWQQSNAKTGNGGIALSKNTVAVEAHNWRRYDFIKPTDRIDCQQIVDVTDKDVFIEIFSRSRHTVVAQVFFGAIEEKRESPEKVLLSPRASGLKKLRKRRPPCGLGRPPAEC